MATTKVELYNGATLVATKTSAPFTSIDWTPVTTGAATLTAKRYEDGVLVATSSVKNYTVNAAAATPEQIVWEQMTSATTSGSGTITRSGGSAGWLGKGYSTKAINGNNAVSAKGSTNSKQMLGLTTGASAAFTNAPIVVVINNLGGTIQVFENGTQVLADTAITLTADTRVYLRLTDGVVTVEANSTVYHTSVASFTLPLTPIAFLHDTGTSSLINTEYEANTNLTTSPI